MVSAAEMLVELAERVQAGRSEVEELVATLDSFENTLSGAQAAASPVKQSRPVSAVAAPAPATPSSLLTSSEVGYLTHAVRELAMIMARAVSFPPAPHPFCEC